MFQFKSFDEYFNLHLRTNTHAHKIQKVQFCGSDYRKIKIVLNFFFSPALYLRSFDCFTIAVSIGEIFIATKADWNLAMPDSGFLTVHKIEREFLLVNEKPKKKKKGVKRFSKLFVVTKSYKFSITKIRLI